MNVTLVRIRRALVSPEFLILAVTTVILSLTYGGPFVVYFVDIQFPFNTHKQFIQLFYAWTSSNLGESSSINIFGLPTTLEYLALASIGTPPWINQFFWNLWDLSLSGIGMLWFLEYFVTNGTGKRLSYMFLLPSMFYMFSIYSVEIAFWDFIPIGPAQMAALPLFVLCVLKGMDAVSAQFRMIPQNLLAIAVLSLFTFGANIPLAVSAIFIFVSFSLFRLITPLAVSDIQAKARRLLYLLVATAISTLANLFWIIPEVFAARTQGVGQGSSSAYSTNVYDFVSSTGQLNLLWAVQLRGMQTNMISWFNQWFNTPGAGGIVLLPMAILVFLPLVLVSRLPTRLARTKVLFLSSALLAAAALYSGAGSPLYNLGLQSVVLNPYVVAALRSTAAALGLALVFIDTCLLGFAALALDGFTQTTAHRKSEEQGLGVTCHTGTVVRLRRGRPSPQLLTSLAVLCIFSAAIAPAVLPGVSGALVPLAPYHARIQIPPFVSEVANYIDDHAGSNYTLLVPGGFQEQNWTGYGGQGYIGTDILFNLIHTPVIASPGGGLGGPPNSMIELAYTDLQLGSHNVGYSRLLSILGVKYVVVERGVGDRYPWGFVTDTNASAIDGFVEAQTNLTKVATFGLDEIYENTAADAPTLYTALNSMSTSLILTNITGAYANDTGLVGNVSVPSTVRCTLAGGGIRINVSGERQDQGLPFPGYPAMFNGVPLGAPLAQYPYLIVGVKTAPSTALEIQFSSVAQLTGGNFNAEWFGTWPYATPGPNAVPISGWYYSPTNITYISISLAAAYTSLSPNSGMTTLPVLNYLEFQFLPTYGSLSENLRPQAHHSNLSAEIVSVNLGTPYFGAAPRNLTANLPPVEVEDATANYVQAVNYTIPGYLSSPLKFVESRYGYMAEANLSTQGGGLSYPGYPTVFNSRALNIPTTTFSCMAITYETLPGTAISLGVSSASHLNQSVFPNQWYDTHDFTYPLNVSGLYESTGVMSTLVIDLRQATSAQQKVIPFQVNGTLNYLYINLVQTQPTRDVVGVFIHQIELGSICESNPGQMQVIESPSLLTATGPPTRIAPDYRTIIVPHGVGPLDASASVSWSMLSPVHYDLKLSDVSGTVLIVFRQNYNAEWSLVPRGTTATISHIEVDDFANGWVVQNATGNLTFDLVYEGQNTMVYAGLASLSTLLGLTIITAASVIVTSGPRLRTAFRQRDRSRFLPKSP